MERVPAPSTYPQTQAQREDGDDRRTQLRGHTLGVRRISEACLRAKRLRAGRGIQPPRASAIAQPGLRAARTPSHVQAASDAAGSPICEDEEAAVSAAAHASLSALARRHRRALWGGTRAI